MGCTQTKPSGGGGAGKLFWPIITFTVNDNSIEYVGLGMQPGNASETTVQCEVGQDINITEISINVQANSLTNPMTVTVRKNMADFSELGTVPTGTGRTTFSGLSLSFLKGEVFALELDCPLGGTNINLRGYISAEPQ